MRKQGQALREVNKPLYRYWQALYLAFFSTRLYVDVGKRWRGFGIAYLLLLLAIATIPFAVRIGLDFERFFTNKIILPFKKLPTFYIQNGQVNFDKPMPYFIKNDSGKVVSIIDTTGTINKIDAAYPDLVTLITKDRVYVCFPSIQYFMTANQPMEKNQIYNEPLTKSQNEIFNGEQWVKTSGIKRLKDISIIMLYPFIVTLFFALFGVSLLVFALMAQYVAKLLLNTSLTFPQASRLLMVSSTPMILTFLFMLTINWFLFGSGILYVALLAIYFTFAVSALKRESQKLVR